MAEQPPSAAGAGREQVLGALRAAAAVLARNPPAPGEIDDELEGELSDLLDLLASLAVACGTERRLGRELVEGGRAAVLGELAAGVAHEINNPVFAILGIVEFLIAGAEAGSKRRARLELIQQSASEIGALVRALVELTRDGNDERGAVSLEQLAKETLELVRRASLIKDVELLGRYGAGSMLVAGRASELRHVLLHLIATALRGVPAGGSIVVEVARERDSVTASVSGPTAELPAGLGLAVCVGIARSHGGELAAGAVASGSRRTLRLPALEADR